MSKPDIFARNRVILTHFDSYSVALLFPRWEKTLLWPTALPDGAAPMRPPVIINPEFSGQAVKQALIVGSGGG